MTSIAPLAGRAHGLVRAVRGSLAGRAWVAFIVAWTLSFALVGLIGLHAQIEKLTDAKYQNALVTLELLAETVADSAIIEDYDTIRRVLLKAVLQPSLSRLQFISSQGAVLEARQPPSGTTHSLLSDFVAARYELPFDDLSRSVIVGGRDYGVLQLSFDREYMHEYVAWILKLGLGAIFLGMLSGLAFVFFPLQRWLRGVVARQELASGPSLLNTHDREAAVAAAPSEFRPLIAKLFDTSMSLGKELEKRERALVMLRDTVGAALGPDQPRSPSLDEVESLLLTIRSILRERAQTLGQLQQALQDATVASKAKDEFLASISHELRTPLNAVIGLSEMIELPESDRANRERVAVILSAGRQLLAIINDVLDFSAIRSGYFETRPGPVDVRAIVEDTVSIASGSVDAPSLTLSTTLDPDMPARVVCDGARLSQILLNLLSNAVKFTRAGHVQVTLNALPEDADGPAMELRVIDSGPGIRESEREVIFEPFGQGAEGRTLRKPGTGLGLSISRALAEKMGGSLMLDASHTPGACFVLRLPLQPFIDTARSAGARSARNEVRAGLRILVAEDTPASQLVMQAMLERLRAQFTIVDNGRQALEALEQAAFDIAILDLQMPEIDGFEAAALIRARYPEIRLIALSAFAGDSHRSRAIAAGFDLYLIKPLRFATISEAIFSCLPPN